MSLFEDPKMEYYRQWDREYDEQRSRAEDARMLAYERKTTIVVENRPAPKVSQTGKQINGVPAVQKAASSALVFRYPDGEKALAAAKKAVKENRSLGFHRRRQEDGSDGFEVVKDGKVIERHIVG